MNKLKSAAAIVFAVLMLSQLSACGQQGALYLPKGEKRPSYTTQQPSTQVLTDEYSTMSQPTNYHAMQENRV